MIKVYSIKDSKVQIFVLRTEEKRRKLLESSYVFDVTCQDITFITNVNGNSGIYSDDIRYDKDKNVDVAVSVHDVVL